MEPERRYATSFDGTKIYYEKYGKGPAIIPCNGIGVSTYFWKYLTEYFEETHTVILWDYRSHGRSGAAPDFSDLTMSTNARDLKAVMDDAGISQAVILGHSMGVQTILEFYRLYPEHVAALIPVLGSYGKPMDTFLGTDKMKYGFPFIYFFVNRYPRLTTCMTQTMYKTLFSDVIAFNGARLIKFINWQHFKIDDLIPYVHHLKTLDLRAFTNMARHMQNHSALPWLKDIKAPTLIIAGEDDLFTPWEISEKMRQLIPGAEMLTIPRGSHAALVEQPELMNLRIEKFLGERLSGSAWAKSVLADKSCEAAPPAAKVASDPAPEKKAARAAKPRKARKALVAQANPA
ncbi:MAG: alpha/beta hydrolase [Thermodesulfobacteriota bacterium]